MKTSILFAAVAAIAVGIVMLANGPLLYGTDTAPQPSPATAYADSAEGLRLTLSVNASSVRSGQTLLVKVSEHNMQPTQLNLSKGERWGFPGLRMDACYASVYPFGMALVYGRYTSANLSEAKPLQTFPSVPCPLLIRLITGYLFEAGSSMAVVLPGTGTQLRMTANATIVGTYSTDPTDRGVRPLTLGTYTILAGDEWGALAFLYVTVH